jgi:hypothetical protein
MVLKTSSMNSPDHILDLLWIGVFLENFTSSETLIWPPEPVLGGFLYARGGRVKLAGNKATYLHSTIERYNAAPAYDARARAGSSIGPTCFEYEYYLTLVLYIK